MCKEDILKHLQVLSNELTKCNSQYELYKLLLYKTKTNLDELNIAPAFFKLTMSALNCDIIVTLSKLFEKANRSSGSIEKLLNKLEYNYSKLKNTKITKEIISEHKKIINKTEEIINNLFTWRDKCYAHIDKVIIDDRGKFFEENAIKFPDLEKLLQDAEEIVGYYHSALTGESHYYKALDCRDVEKVIKILEEHNLARPKQMQALIQLKETIRDKN